MRGYTIFPDLRYQPEVNCVGHAENSRALRGLIPKQMASMRLTPIAVHSQLAAPMDPIIKYTAALHDSALAIRATGCESQLGVYR
jgi:hypothetical protein